MTKYEYVEIEEKDKSNSKSVLSPFKVLFQLLLKIVFSPLIVLIIAYVYYEDTRKAFLVALAFYTVLTIVSLLKTLIQIFLSMMTFNLFKFIRKSFKVITMLAALVIYWISYIFAWGTNFTL